MLKYIASLIFFVGFYSAAYEIPETTFEYEYLGGFNTDFYKFLGYESGSLWGRFRINQRPKITHYCPFKTS